MNRLSVLILLTVILSTKSQSNEVVGEDLGRWCFTYFDKFWNSTYLEHSRKYYALTCCSRFAHVAKLEAAIRKCESECEKANDSCRLCEVYCIYREQNIFINGTLNKEQIKEQCMASVRSDVELAKKYETIVDESIRKCVAACKLNLSS